VHIKTGKTGGTEENWLLTDQYRRKLVSLLPANHLVRQEVEAGRTDVFGPTPWQYTPTAGIEQWILEIRRAGKSSASIEQIRCPLTRFYAWQINVHNYQGPNPASDLKFFIGRQPSKRSRKRDLQWFPQTEAKILLEACRGLKPRWCAFLMVGFGGGLRWGEITGLVKSDIDWPRQRVHVQRTWSEDGGRIEPCKDGEDRWVKLTPATMAALRAHCESMDLEGSLKR